MTTQLHSLDVTKESLKLIMKMGKQKALLYCATMSTFDYFLSEERLKFWRECYNEVYQFNLN